MTSKVETNGHSNSTTNKINGVEQTISKPKGKSPRTPKRIIFLSIVLLFITYITYPSSLQPTGKPTIEHVFYYGWISAISTGLGVLPLVFVPDLDKYWIGVSNAIASGMMVAASYSLIIEGCSFDEPDDISDISPTTRTILGSILGLGFIFGTKSFLDGHDEFSLGDLEGADARKIILIFFVMFLHSFTEGVGIGVSFGGERGHELGVFISASLAVHNIPEGLAVAIVMLPQNISKLTAACWCIASSIPQPLMAVPAFLFVHYFIPILPVGLGFAGGAMAWVAFCELLVEAYEDTDLLTTGLISTTSLGFMLYIQDLIDER